MLFSTIVTAFLFISAVTGQSTTPAPLPSLSPTDDRCIRFCLDTPVVQQSGTACEATNPSCLCRDNKFISEASQCLVGASNCKSTPLEVSERTIDAWCSRAGVTVHLDLNAVASSISSAVAAHTSTSSGTAPTPTNASGSKFAHLNGVGYLMGLGLVAAVL